MGNLAQQLDDNYFPVPGALSPGTSQDISFDGSTQSTAFGEGTRLVRLVSTQSCRLAFGLDPTAEAAGMLLPAGVVEFVKVRDGWKVAALKTSSTGSLNCTEYGG